MDVLGGISPQGDLGQTGRAVRPQCADCGELRNVGLSTSPRALVGWAGHLCHRSSSKASVPDFTVSVFHRDDKRAPFTQSLKTLMIICEVDFMCFSLFCHISNSYMLGRGARALLLGPGSCLMGLHYLRLDGAPFQSPTALAVESSAPFSEKVPVSP